MFWFQAPVSNPISQETPKKTGETKRRAEEPQRQERQEDPVEVNDIRPILFERSLQRQTFEQNLRIQTYKDYLLE